MDDVYYQLATSHSPIFALAPAPPTWMTRSPLHSLSRRGVSTSHPILTDGEDLERREQVEGEGWNESEEGEDWDIDSTQSATSSPPEAAEEGERDDDVVDLSSATSNMPAGPEAAAVTKESDIGHSFVQVSPILSSTISEPVIQE